MAADFLTLQGYLIEAELALHKLMTGSSEETVSYEGKSVKFRDIDVYRLQAYIASLKQQIAALQGNRVGRGPIHFSF